MKEKLNDYEFLSAQTSALGDIILELYPNMDGQYYEDGSCGAAAYILMDLHNKRGVGNRPLPDEYVDKYRKLLQKHGMTEDETINGRKSP